VDYDNFGTESVSKNRFGMEVNTIVDGTKRQGNFTFRPDRALPAGIRTPAFPFLFSRLQMPAEQHFLKRELHTEHSILVQLKQLHGFPTNSTVETIVDSDDKIAQQDSTGMGELRFALSSGKLVIH
jgi:hypothetical protein